MGKRCHYYNSGTGTVKAASDKADDIGGGYSNRGNKGSQGNILIVNRNITVTKPKPLTKILLDSKGARYRYRIIGIIETGNNDQELNKLMTATDNNGELKFYYHNETGAADKILKFTNRYPDYTCKTDVINKAGLQKLIFTCELTRGIICMHDFTIETTPLYVIYNKYPPAYLVDIY